MRRKLDCSVGLEGVLENSETISIATLARPGVALLELALPWSAALEVGIVGGSYEQEFSIERPHNDCLAEVRITRWLSKGHSELALKIAVCPRSCVCCFTYGVLSPAPDTCFSRRLAAFCEPGSRYELSPPSNVGL